MLAEADPKLKAAVYADLGITLTYRPEDRVVVAESRPVAACTNERVGGGT
jgi:hypothetical protein